MNICIVGASRGLGRELSRHFLKDGHRVWGVARSETGLREVEKESDSGTFRWSVIDLLDAGSLQTWKQTMEKELFHPDVIILNASVQLDDMQHGYDHAQGRTVLRTNLEGSLSCISLFLPDFLARKKGQFVAIASTAALRPSVRSASYSAAKAGLMMALRALRLRYRESGIAFRTVMLGPVQTEMWEGRQSALVPSASSAAGAVARFVYARNNVLYYPWVTTALLRLSRCLPDRIFARLSSTFLK